MTTTCNFCGTTSDETDEIMIEGRPIFSEVNVFGGSIGTGINAAICETCVDVCNEMIAAHKKSEAAPTTPQNHKE